MQRKLKRHSAWLWESTDSEKTWEDLKFTLRPIFNTETVYNNNNTNKQTKYSTTNSEERGKYAFKIYHIFQFIYSVLNKKFKAYKKKQKNMVHSKEKQKNKKTKTVPEKYLIVNLLRLPRWH